MSLTPLLAHHLGFPLEELLVPALPLAGGLAVTIRAWWHRHTSSGRTRTCPRHHEEPR